MKIPSLLVLSALALAPPLSGCDLSTGKDAPASPTRKKQTKKKRAADGGEPVDPSGWTFVRRPEAGAQPEGVDACAFIGGLGFNCITAILAEDGEVERRYMRRLSDADARESLSQMEQGEPMGVPHAEIAMSCADEGPCKQTRNGVDMDDGYACLTKAEAALREKDEAASRRAHARACRCDPKRAQIPIMGGILACDGPGEPVRRGASLSLEEAKQIRACATCDAKEGPGACAAEIERLRKTDRTLAAYLEDVHVPRCQKP